MFGVINKIALMQNNFVLYLKILVWKSCKQSYLQLGSYTWSCYWLCWKFYSWCMNVKAQKTISDHMVKIFKTFVNHVPKNKAVINFCNFKSLDVVDFSNHLLTTYEQMLWSNCIHLTNMSPMCVNYKTNFYRYDASSYINQKAPLNCKEIYSQGNRPSLV